MTWTPRFCELVCIRSKPAYQGATCSHIGTRAGLHACRAWIVLVIRQLLRLHVTENSRLLRISPHANNMRPCFACLISFHTNFKHCISKLFSLRKVRLSHFWVQLRTRSAISTFCWLEHKLIQLPSPYKFGIDKAKIGVLWEKSVSRLRLGQVKIVYTSNEPQFQGHGGSQNRKSAFILSRWCAGFFQFIVLQALVSHCELRFVINRASLESAV